MFQNYFLTSFIRRFTKTSNKKNIYINNSLKFNKLLKNTNFKPEDTIKNLSYKNKKRIEFHESHSRRGYVIEKFSK
tara:strand:+ start:46 stop:273 length:228 start_codon:yes stop_codon:yes gene_type:complete